MDEKQTPIGELFSRLYLERGVPGVPAQNPFFRNRLDAFLQANHYKDYAELSIYLKQEAGLTSLFRHRPRPARLQLIVQPGDTALAIVGAPHRHLGRLTT
jgi:hypothetical protein